MSNFRFTDFFAGLGGFHLAAAALGGACVFACEIEDELQELYYENHGMRPHGDIRTVLPEAVPEHDVLCAGFPCQPFSKAGSQTGLKDRLRGTVIFNLIKIIEKCRPRYVLLENVPHFVRHDDGDTYDKLRKALVALGYGVQYCEYSPHQFGIPQIRQRVYLVAKLGGLNGFVWPSAPTVNPETTLLDILDKQPADAKPITPSMQACLGTWQKFLKRFPVGQKLPSFPIWSMEFKATYPFTKYDSLHKMPVHRLSQYRGSFGVSLRSRYRTDILDRLPSHARAGSSAFPMWKQKFIQQNRRLYRDNKSWLDKWLPQIRGFPPSLQKFEWNCQGEERDIWKYVIQFRASGVRVKRPTTVPALVAMTTSQVPIIGWEKRYITPRECARLQSMDRLKVLPSGPRAVRAFGNAVNVEVVKKILSSLLQ